MSSEGMDDVLGRGSRKITLPGGDRVRVDVCRVRHLGKVTKLIAGMLVLVQENQAAGGTTGDIGTMFGNPANMLLLIDRLSTDVFSLCSLLSDLSEDKVENLLPDDAAALLSAVLEDNYRFFIKNVLPLLKTALAAANLESLPTPTLPPA